LSTSQLMMLAGTVLSVRNLLPAERSGSHYWRCRGWRWL